MNETPPNRMLKGKPGPWPPEKVATFEVTPVEIIGKVTPLTCPKCGRAQQPRTLRRYLTYADVQCSSCGAPAQFHFATENTRAVLRFVR